MGNRHDASADLAVTVIPPVVVVPAQLFLDFSHTRRLSKRLLIRYATDDDVPRREEIALRHQLPMQVEMQLSPAVNRMQSAILNFVFDQPPSTADGQRTDVQIAFGPPLNRVETVAVRTHYPPHGRPPE